MEKNEYFRPETKYFPPKLMKKFGFICSYPLTLLEASSGFGKTTVAMHFLETGVPKTADVYRHIFLESNLQEGWKQFCGLIARFDQSSANKLLDVGVPEEDTMCYIKRVLAALVCKKETYLFLDDMHEWKIPQLREFIVMLSNHRGENLHIIVVIHPSVGSGDQSIIRSSKLLHLQEEDFAFSKEDASLYFIKAGLTLSEKQLDQVMELTNGWIIALYLQLDSLIRKGSFEEGELERLLKKTFWNQLSKEKREVFLHLSVFDSFTYLQAAQLSGGAWEDVENRLHQQYFFIRYDKEEERYYIHTQLRRFLKKRFMLLTEDRQKELYVKCGDLAYRENDHINAIRFYYYAKSWEKILSLPLTSYKIAEVLNETTLHMILDVLAQTPYEVKTKYPKTLIPFVLLLFFAGCTHELLKYKDELKGIILDSSISEQERNALMGELELSLSFLEYNRIADMGRRHKRAYALLQGSTDLINPQSAWTFGAPSVLYLFWREAGKLNEELEQLDEYLPIYNQLTKGHGTGGDGMMHAEAHLNRGELEDAERLCYWAMLAAEEKKQNSIVQCGAFALARIALLKGDDKMFQESCHSLRRTYCHNTEDFSRNTFALANGYLAILSGREEEVEPWLAEGRIKNRFLITVKPLAFMVYAKVLIMKKEYQKLLGISQYSMGISSVFPNLLPQLYIKIYKAQALYEIGQREVAIQQLNEAFEMALPDGIILPFSENYDGVKEMLCHTICDEETKRKIEALFYRADTQRKEEDCKIDSLTNREREVLALLVKGRTNQQIAEELFMSFSAAKKHVSSILKKFDMTSREMLKGKYYKKNGR